MIISIKFFRMTEFFKFSERSHSKPASLTVIFTCLVIPGDWQIGLVRLKMTVLGTVIALLATIYIFLSRASNRLPQ